MTIPIPEKDLMQAIVDEAIHNGWLVYHTYDSRRSTPGFPDLVLVHPTRRLIVFAEVKSKAKLTKQQQEWLMALRMAGGWACVWRPETLDQVYLFLMGQLDVPPGLVGTMDPA